MQNTYYLDWVEKILKGGEVLYRQGNLGDSIYFLAEGLLCSSIEESRNDA